MKRELLVFLFFLVLNGVYAQENCSNGIDDNGNGLIDCNDPECQFAAILEKGCNCDDGIDNDSDGQIDIYDADCASYYGLTFVQDGTGDCSIPPPDSLDFFQFIDTPGQTQQNTVDTQSKMAIGDLDGDGIPEVIATSKWNKEIRIISSGGDGIHPAGDIIDQFGTTGGDDIFPSGNYVYELELAIADIDGDGDGEIFAIASKRKTPNSEPDGYYMVALTFENEVLTPMYDAVYIDPERPGMIAIADFDGDGLSEIYFKDQIYAAETGALLAQGSGDWNTEVNSAPVAVNVLPGTPNLELVCGNIIYNVPNLSNRNPAVPINLTVAKDLNDLGAQFYPKVLFDAQEYGVTNYSSTSVADVNGDGNIDVVLSGAVGSENGNTAIFFWDVANNTYSIYEPPDPFYPGGWPWGTSRPNLGDANGDGQLDILFIAGNQLFALTLDGGGNLVPLWPTPRIINDSRSGIVAVTIYDFENDGHPEVVYRDSQQLVIVDGDTGQDVFWSTVCQSHTMTEGPIIADVDGNGSTDITIPCYYSKNSFNINAQIQQQALGVLRIFYSAENLWLPTRKVWNQSGYFVVNVNDDLTIPRHQMDQGIIFGDDPCFNGVPGPIRPFNIFLNQAPSIGPDGCPFYPAPDISFVGDNPNAQPGDPDYKDPNDPTYFPAVHVIPPICGDLGIEVEFNIINDGALTISSSIPVSFWDGDPTIDPPPANPATLLYTTNLQLNDFQVGDTMQIEGVTFNSTGKAFRLYIVLNDDGSSLPVDPGGSGLAECRIENNVYYYDIIPDPFEVDIAKVQDNIKCEDSAPDNGELRAVITRNGVVVNDYSDFAFQWYDGIGTANPIPAPDGTTNVLTGLAEGDYSLVVTNTDKGCASIPTDTSIVRIGVDPEITIVENSPQSQCDPPNGELEVFITGGNTGYTFEWFDRLLNPLNITGSVASNLVAGEYIVSVFKDGCTKTASYTLAGPIFPIVDASVIQNVVDCANLNSGAITAEASINGIPQDSLDYTFRWYEWDSLAMDVGSILAPSHGTGPTRTGLLPGEYAVVARDENTGCETSPPVRVQVQDLTVIPTIVVTEVEPQTSCDPANPNGVLRADGYVAGVLQDPSALTFEWFDGDNTLPANLITTVSGINGEIAEGIANSGLPYTVRVTTAFNCSSTLAYSDLTENLEIPELSAVTFDNSICDPALALGGVFNGRVEASASLSGVPITDFSAYTFTWYDGDDITSDPVLTNTSSDGDILYGLDAGRYTVTLERNATRCISDPLINEIFDVTIPPVVNIMEIPATNCVGGTPNGELTAQVDLGGSYSVIGYSFSWFEGVDTSPSGTPVNTVTGIRNETAQQLTANSTYTVLVTNDSSGCSITESYVVTDESQLPIVDLTKIDNTICDILLPSVNAYDGSATATVTDRGAPVSNFAKYTFEWFDGPTTSDPLLTNTNSDGDVLQEIPGGFYTVRVTNDSLGCISDPLFIEVMDVIDLPVISLDETPATNCDPAFANGEVAASVGGGTAGFLFKWVAGNDVTAPAWPPVAGTANEIALSLQAGNTYTVQVTNENTGCANTEGIVISDSSALPLVTLSQTPNSICDPAISGNPFNGQVNGSTTYNGVPVSDFSNYIFNLFEANDTSGPLAGTITAGPADFMALENGFYTVQAYDQALGCYSDPVSIEVLENFTFPVIDIAEVAATNCDPSLANGELSASVQGTTLGYSFKWVEGIDTSDPALDTQPGITGLSAGSTYTIKVTTDSTGCFGEESWILSDSSTVPEITLNQTPNSICDTLIAGVPYNGTINGATLYNGAAVSDYSDYYFNLFEGSDTTGVLNNSVTASALNFIELENGFYTARAYNTALGCYSDPVTIEVLEDFILPVVDLDETPATNCDPSLANGIVTASVGGNSVGYMFKWVAGNDVNGSAWTPVTGGSGQTALDLLAGDLYTVKVTNENTGCFNTEGIIISDSSALPIVALSQLPNSICDPAISGNPFNGEVNGSTTYNGAPVIDFTNYSFNLFEGNDTTGVLVNTISAAPADFVALENGFYTVRAYELALGCYSDPVSIEVLEDFTFPVIDIAEVAATNCDPSLANGELSASVQGTTLGYGFKWVEGIDTSDPALDTQPGITGLLAGNTYTVRVTTDSTGCFGEESRILSDSSMVPEITLNQTPNSICDTLIAGVPYNGTINGATLYNGAAVSDYSDYYFNLFEGSDTTSILNNSVTASALNFIELENGFYTARAYNTALGCYSDPVTIEVLEDFVFPVINLTETAATNCNPALANGQVTADVGGSVSGYIFKWVQGINVNDPEWSFISGSANETAESLLAGTTYTVRATTSATGCFGIESLVISDSSEIPVVSLVQNPNTICDPVVAGVPYDGTVTGTTTYRGLPVSDYSNYYFNLFEGNDTTGVLNNTMVGGAINFTELQNGIYTARAYNTALGCYGDPETIEVLENFVFPVISLTEKGATNCDPSLPNGSLSASDAGVIAGRTFKWVAGLDISGAAWMPVSGTENETADALSSGSSYTVQVTIDATGCFETAARMLSDSSEVPILSLLQTPNTICDDAIAGAFDGTITGSMTYYGNPVVDFTPYDFNLFEGNDTTGVVLGSINGSNPAFIELQDGDYTARAYDFATGCFSSPVTIMVQDNTILPTILITKEPNSSCDDAQPNGNIQAYVDAIGNTADHDFTWYNGATATPGNETAASGSVGEIITLLGNQNYTVEVTSQITGCANTLSTFLNRIIPTYDLSIAVTDIVDCNTPGSILATIDSSGTVLVNDTEYTNFEFYWYRGEVVNTGNELPETSRYLTEVSPGVDLYSEDYTVYAVNSYTHCISNDVTGFVAAPAALFDIQTEINFYPSDCETDEGALTAWVDNGGIRDYNNYSFYWYAGRNINPGSNFYTDPPVAFVGDSLNTDFPDGSISYSGSPQPHRKVQEGPTIYNLGDGMYSVLVQDHNSGCFEYLEIPLPSIITPPTLLGTVQGSTLCPYDIGDGIVEAAINPDSLTSQNLFNSDYDFYLYEGISTDAGDLVSGPILGEPDRITFTELSNILAPGYYTVVANERVSGSYCPSVPLTLEIETLALPPIVSLNSDLINNSSCDSTWVNGMIDLLVEKDPDDLTGPSTYSLTWTSTALTIPANSINAPPGPQGPYNGLNFGTYDVTVVDENTTCETTETYVLYNEPPEILVDETTLIVTDKYYCIPSGSIEITNIEVGGNPEPLSDFSFVWYDGSVNLGTGTPIGPPAITERLDSVNYGTIHDGTYYIIVTKDPAAGGEGAGCSSVPFAEEILDRSIDPTVILSQTANLACDSSFATGTISLAATTGGSLASNYEFTLKSTALPDSINGFTGAGGAWTEIHLGPGQYNVWVRDVDNECTSTNMLTIDDNPSIPYIELPDLTILPQAICDFDGSVTVNAVRVNGIAEIPGTNPGEVNYIFTWYELQPLPPDLGIFGNLLDTSTYPLVEAGAYWFTALRNNNAHEAGEGCETAPYRVEIPDATVDPTINLAQTANRACDLSFATGSLTLNVNTGGAVSSDYGYTITSAALGGPLNGFTNDDGTPESWTELNLGPGQYNVQVTDVDNFCVNNRTISINNNPAVPYVEAADLTIMPQAICANDGSITVNAIQINGVPEIPGVVNYEFTWFAGQPTGTDLGVTGNVLDTTNYPGIQAGTYYFTALRDQNANEPGEGCETAPFAAVIEDVSVDPTLILAQTANRACDLSFATGSLTLNVNTGGAVSSDYGYTITSAALGGPLNGFTNDDGTPESWTELNLGPGQYNVQVTDVDNFCVNNRTITINNNPAVPYVEAADLTIMPQAICANDGSITVNAIQINGVAETPGTNPGEVNYVFTWYDGQVSPPDLGVSGNVLDTTNYPGIQAGTYYFTALRDQNANEPGEGCETAPFPAEIEDISVDPTLILAQTANRACDLSFATGSLTLNVNTGGAVSSDYGYTITSAALGGPLNGFTNDDGTPESWTELNLGPGQYNVQVTDVDNFCVNNRTISINNNPAVPYVEAADLTIMPQAICANDGSITVNAIQINGVPEIPGVVNYEFTWFAGQPTGTDLGVTGNVLDTTNYPGIQAGTYYFTALRDQNANEPGEGCETAPFAAVIEDVSVDPTLILAQTANRACDLSFATGSLTLNVNTGGAVSSDYGYTITSAALGGPLNGFTNDDGTPESWTELNLGPGQYNVQVTDVDNFCVNNRTITINNNPAVPYVEAADLTIMPQAICANDGSITVNAIQINGVAETPGTNPGEVNYVFTWYDGQVSPPDLGVSGNVLDTTNYPGIQAGTYYFTALRDQNANEPGEGCETAPFAAVIEDVSVDPILALTSTSNQSCDTSVVANGTIQAVITPSANSLGNFNYTWISFPTGRPLEFTGGTGTVNEQFLDLTYGQYNLLVEDADTRCIANRTVTINNNPVVPVISDYLVNDQTVCFNDGSIIVTSMTPGDTSAYNFTWYDGVTNYNNNAPIAGVTGAMLDTTQYTTIQAGDFYFTATKTDPADPVGFACISSPVKATIRDLSIDPFLALTPTANQNCDLSFANGTLTALATTNGIQGPSYSFTLTSTVLGAPVDSLNNDSQVIYDFLQPGNYNVLVVDDNTLCTFNRNTTINDSPVYIDINDILYTVNDQTICAPDGSVMITDITDQGISQPLTDYTYIWYEGTSNLNSNNPLGPTDSYLDTTNYASIGAGIYFFTVTRSAGTSAPGEGCESAPLRADIMDISTDPNISFAQTYNTSCDILNPNGEISAIAVENDGTNTDIYSFAWSFNGSSLPPGVVQIDSANTSVLSDAPDGNYQLTVINTSRTLCQVTGGSPLKIDLHVSEPNIIIVDVIDPLNCNPTGQLEVTQIQVGGIPANVNDFEYEWYHGNFNPGDLILDSLGNPVTSSLLPDQYPEKYYVIARNIGTACESNPKEATISNANIIYPAIYIDAIAPQTSCDPVMPNAALMATVDGGNDDSNPNYQFEWFNSLDGTGAVIATTSSIYGLGADNFSVTVLDLITNCASMDYYITEDAIELYKPVISVAASPRDNCAVNNGTASAEVINVNGNFEFNWYVGDQPGTIPDYTGPFINGLPVGQYTVVATEMDTTFCLSDPVTVTIDDERMKPVITITEDNPLTNCWDDSPNGQFTATVNGVVGGYTFEWYIGSDTTGIADYMGSTWAGLSPQSYTVVVTDIRTQCDEVATRTITDNTVTPPMPDPEVVQHYQSCIEPDGWVRASVGGDVVNYTFSWYDGSIVSGSPDHNGINYMYLLAGQYTVTAMDMVTGCVSPGVPVEVLDLRDTVAFSYNVVPANCEENNGSIELVWENDVPVREIIWVDPITGSLLDQGSAIYNYPPGVYGVVVTSVYGCETKDEMEIPIDIFEFNGISANGDGRNDYFEIACITQFPNNNVKIFNRAGQLVFEANHYDNLSTVFKGIGENGMYLMGKELPDGTYFYIINKGDGSEPIPGFLELIR